MKAVGDVTCCSPDPIIPELLTEAAEGLIQQLHLQWTSDGGWVVWSPCAAPLAATVGIRVLG